MFRSILNNAAVSPALAGVLSILRTLSKFTNFQENSVFGPIHGVLGFSLTVGVRLVPLQVPA